MSNQNALIYVVDDEDGVRIAISESLLDAGYRVEDFSNAEDCLKATALKPCDLIVSDVNMPGIGGSGLLQAIGKRRKNLPVILVTGFGDIPSAVDAIQSGAAQYLEKPIEESKLLATVQTALSGATGNQNLPTAPPQFEQLTEKENTVLRLVVEGLTNKEIAEKLGRSVRTVENHRHRIHKKMGTSTTAELVRVALEA